MIAIWVLVANATNLAQLHMRVATSLPVRIFLIGRRIRVVAWLARSVRILLREILTSQEQHLFVEAADDGDLWLRLLSVASTRRCLSSTTCLAVATCGTVWLL